jgi:phosphatidylserine/phosphatidylglycerophosphate/cardiolipin synthase-like enzyme
MSATPPIPLAVGQALVRPIADQAYLPALLGLVAEARRRLLCSMFIVDVTPRLAGGFEIDDILGALAEARWRGVEVRLLIGGSRDNLALAEVAEAARARALTLGLSCRWLTSREVRGSHAKIVIADEHVLTGSHNWSPGAVAGSDQTQDSVLVRSADLAAVLTARFEAQWQRADPEVARAVV